MTGMHAAWGVFLGLVGLSIHGLGGSPSRPLGNHEVMAGKANGDPCAAPSECDSGFCVDGFCCNQACTGLCMACSEAKNGQKDGACWSIKPDTDPDNECPADEERPCRKPICGSGSCAFTLREGTCLSQGVCYQDGDVSADKCDVCRAGVGLIPRPEGTPCVDDGASCTDDRCGRGNGRCEHKVSTGSCLIGDACYAAGDVNPNNACEACDPALNPRGWSVSPSCADAGPVSDAGADVDAATDAEVDAATDAEADASLDAGPTSDGGARPDGGQGNLASGGMTTDDGCACSVRGESGTQRGFAFFAVGLAAAALLVRRRSRSPRSDRAA